MLLTFVLCGQDRLDVKFGALCPERFILKQSAAFYRSVVASKSSLTEKTKIILCFENGQLQTKYSPNNFYEI